MDYEEQHKMLHDLTVKVVAPKKKQVLNPYSFQNWVKNVKFNRFIKL